MSTIDSKLDYAVDIFELSKSFNRSKNLTGSYTTLKSLVTKPFQKKIAQNIIQTTAIKDLTIRIPRGASVGIIGRNGSGKSTLLKLITGIYAPDHGHVKINGEVRALIELGAGFHPDFTGRENLYLAGILYGLTKKQINEKFDQIVEFAELQDFIDQPVRTYSSGMFMRLGFSLAVNTDPDILLIDEVLAVGDAGFVQKCQEKVAELRSQEKTLFMVSHDLGAIERWSDEVIWLNKGEVKDRGHPRRVIDHYREFIEKGIEEEILGKSREATQISVNAKTAKPEAHEELEKFAYERWGSREIEITRATLTNFKGEEKVLFHTGEPSVVNIYYKIHAPQKSVVFGFGINRADGLNIIGTNTHLERVETRDLAIEGVVSIVIPSTNLLTNTYYLDLAVHREDGYAYDYHKNAIKFSVQSQHDQIGVLHLQHSWQFNS